jgi:hypothetical protein
VIVKPQTDCVICKKPLGEDGEYYYKRPMDVETEGLAHTSCIKNVGKVTTTLFDFAEVRHLHGSDAYYVWAPSTDDFLGTIKRTSSGTSFFPARGLDGKQNCELVDPWMRGIVKAMDAIENDEIEGGER